MTLVKISKIKIGERHRKDLGDLNSLKDSILKIGLMHPIVVDKDTMTLIAGERRLTACKELMWEEIECTLLSIDDIVEGEFHENEIRKDFTGPECVAIIDKIAERKKKKGSKLDPGKTFDDAAKVTGRSRGSLWKLKTIVEKAEEDPEKFGHVLEKLEKGPKDKKMSVDFAYKTVTNKIASETPTPDLPTEQYEVIYIDPPWKYDLELSGSPDYKTMTIEEMIKEIPQLPAYKDCVLFMWVTNPKNHEAMELLTEWGFEYRTKMTWVKTKDKKVSLEDEIEGIKLQKGTGHYIHGADEMLWIAIKGSPGTPTTDARPASVIFAERTTIHSQKPNIFYEIIEKMYPAKKKLEMFSRNVREGWEAWGDSLEQ